MTEEAQSLAETIATVGSKSRPPRSFYAISGLLLVWNIVGVVFFFMEVTMSEEARAALDTAQRALIDATPTGLFGVYAVAVGAGTLGCLLLLLRKVLAFPVLIVSLLCIAAQMGYSLTMTEALEVYGGGIVAQAALITVIGIYLVWYARRARDNGWLS